MPANQQDVSEELVLSEHSAAPHNQAVCSPNPRKLFVGTPPNTGADLPPHYLNHSARSPSGHRLSRNPWLGGGFQTLTTCRIRSPRFATKRLHTPPIRDARLGAASAPPLAGASQRLGTGWAAA